MVLLICVFVPMELRLIQMTSLPTIPQFTEERYIQVFWHYLLLEVMKMVQIYFYSMKGFHRQSESNGKLKGIIHFQRVVLWSSISKWNQLI